MSEFSVLDSKEISFVNSIWGQHELPSRPLKYSVQLVNEKISVNNGQSYVGLENVESSSGVYVRTQDYSPDGASLLFKTGDILFGKLRPYLAKSWCAIFCGVCSSEFLVLRSKFLPPKYLNYVTLTQEFLEAVNSTTYGAKMPRASWEDIGDFPIPAPEYSLAKKIALFLDHETAKIDTLISQQQKLIELLKEKRQAVISHAVTKGLNPDAPMKDSGVEWLGEIPEGWEVKQIRHVLNGMEQGSSPSCESRPADRGEWGVLKTSCVNWGIYREEENKALPKSTIPITEYEVKKGDLLMSRASGSKELIGSVAVVEETAGKILLSDKIFRLKTTEDVEKSFLYYCMGSDIFRKQIESTISGGEGLANNITKSSILGFRIPFPTCSEQKAIGEYLKEDQQRSSSLINAAKELLGLLEEKKSSLISAAVTGKIDVRNWQPPEPTQ